MASNSVQTRSDPYYELNPWSCQATPQSQLALSSEALLQKIWKLEGASGAAAETAAFSAARQQLQRCVHLDQQQQHQHTLLLHWLLFLYWSTGQGVAIVDQAPWHIPTGIDHLWRQLHRCDWAMTLSASLNFPAASILQLPHLEALGAGAWCPSRQTQAVTVLAGLDDCPVRGHMTKHREQGGVRMQKHLFTLQA